MNELAKSIQELVTTINSGANGLGETINKHGPEMWRSAVYHAQIVAWSDVAVFSLALFALCFAAKKSLGAYKDDGDAGYMLAAIVCLVLAFICLACAGSSIPAILNPEYAAASDIAKRILGK